MTPAASDDGRLYSQANFSVKNQDILNDDALHFKLASFEFTNLKYFNSTFMNLKHRHARRARVIFLCELLEIEAFMVQ